MLGYAAIAEVPLSTLPDSSGSAEAPAAPSSLTATALTSSSIQLTWTDNADDETGFEVDRSTDGSSWSSDGTAAENATSYVSRGLSPETLYYFRVRATNTGGDSDNSDTATATTLAFGGLDRQIADIITLGFSGNTGSVARVPVLGFAVGTELGAAFFTNEQITQPSWTDERILQPSFSSESVSQPEFADEQLA